MKLFSALCTAVMTTLIAGLAMSSVAQTAYEAALPADRASLGQAIPAGQAGVGRRAERTRQAMARFTQFTTEQLIPGTRAPGASPELPFWLADDYLRALAMLLMAWAWALLDARGPATLANGHQAYVRWVRPEAAMRADMVRQAL